MQGILAESSTQATEVVVLANAIDLEVLTIEPEARLSIKTEIAEAGGGFDFVDNLAARNQLRAYLIYLRGVAAPLLESGERPRLPYCHLERSREIS